MNEPSLKIFALYVPANRFNQPPKEVESFWSEVNRQPANVSYISCISHGRNFPHKLLEERVLTADPSGAGLAALNISDWSRPRCVLFQLPF